MKDKNEYLNDDYIYPFDFEEKFDYTMQVKDILKGSFKIDGNTYFNLWNCHFEFEGHGEIHLGLHKIYVDHANSSCTC